MWFERPLGCVVYLHAMNPIDRLLELVPGPGEGEENGITALLLGALLVSRQGRALSPDLLLKLRSALG